MEITTQPNAFPSVTNQTNAEIHRKALIGAVMSVALTRGCTAHALRALLYILENLRPDGTAEISLQEVAEHLHRHRITICRELKSLERAGLLASVRQQRGPKIFELSPALIQSDLSVIMSHWRGAVERSVESRPPARVFELADSHSPRGFELADSRNFDADNPKTDLPPNPPRSSGALSFRSKHDDEIAGARVRASSFEFQKLREAGVSEHTAHRLIAQHPRELITAWIAALPHVDVRVSRSGFLVKALDEGWELPERFRRAQAAAEQILERTIEREAAGLPPDRLTPEELAESQRRRAAMEARLRGAVG